MYVHQCINRTWKCPGGKNEIDFLDVRIYITVKTKNYFSPTMGAIGVTITSDMRWLPTYMN